VFLALAGSLRRLLFVVFDIVVAEPGACVPPRVLCSSRLLVVPPADDRAVVGLLLRVVDRCSVALAALPPLGADCGLPEDLPDEQFAWTPISHLLRVTPEAGLLFADLSGRCAACRFSCARFCFRRNDSEVDRNLPGVGGFQSLETLNRS